MAKANIKMKSGTTINVEGTPQEIAEVLATIKKREEREVQTQISKQRKSKLNVTDFILHLREEGFFNKPKTLFAIKSKLEENGMIYPMTTLSGLLIKLVRRRELGRVREEKMWGYVKR